MKKLLAMFVVLGVLVGGVAGCGEGKKTTTPPPAPNKTPADPDAGEK